MEGTVFAPALDGMKHVKSEDGVMLTKPFLDVCKLILPVIGVTSVHWFLTNLMNETVAKQQPWNLLSSVAMKLAPDRTKFLEVVGGKGDVKSDIENSLSTFAPFLEENHKFLASVGMDGLKSS
ncbi:UNVERIFIED_CONTAM: Glycolipid transfer protein 1 [Sesamum calycinum]|uniref:Glycolipid transfer protein 1 n=1 Tax=Sesamum calycinum TaxID=2727403 RepID=A0AAW2RTW7_9LAMI